MTTLLYSLIAWPGKRELLLHKAPELAEMYKHHISNATKFSIQNWKTFCLGSKQTKYIYGFSILWQTSWSVRFLGVYSIYGAENRTIRRKPHGTAFRLKAARSWLMSSSISKLPGSLNLRPEKRLRTSSTVAPTGLSLSPSSTVSFTYPLPSPLSHYQSSTNPLFPGGRRSRQILINIKTLTLGKIEGKRRWGNRGWDGWTASATRWTWVWANSRREGRTGKPGELQSKGSQRVSYDIVTERQQWTMQSRVSVNSDFWCFGGSFYSQNLCFKNTKWHSASSITWWPSLLYKLTFDEHFEYPRRKPGLSYSLCEIFQVTGT